MGWSLLRGRRKPFRPSDASLAAMTILALSYIEAISLDSIAHYILPESMVNDEGREEVRIYKGFTWGGKVDGAHISRVILNDAKRVNPQISQTQESIVYLSVLRIVKRGMVKHKYRVVVTAS